MIVTAAYEDKAVADANMENAKASLGKVAEFMTEEPLVREVEIVCGVDGDQSVTPGYVRFVFGDFGPSKYDAFISDIDGVGERFRGISGLRSVRFSRILENRLASVAFFDSKASADAAQDSLAAILAGGGLRHSRWIGTTSTYERENWY